jgi:SAM-dependent methyltransferase
VPALVCGGRVLEIGAGTGLFALMAARAGADEVISCERRPAVARGAKSVVAHNGFSDKIRVVNKASTELKIGVDLNGPADVLVWDNLANNLMGVGALGAIEDAMRRLVKPGGQVIPARCAIRAALAEDGKLDTRRLGRIDGFDLSPFNALARPVYTINTASPELAVRSAETTLFDFDFSGGGPFPAGRASSRVVGTGGPANGVVQWLEFGLDDNEVYRPGPGVEARAFGLEFHPLAEPFEAARGAGFTIRASHDRDRLRIWLGEG